MDFSPDLVRGSIVPVVLALLDERPMYGYEIVKIVNVRTNGRLEWKEGTVYPTLHRLEKQRLVRSKWKDKEATEHVGEGGANTRKYYSITHKGRTELVRHREQWTQFSHAVNIMLVER